MKTIRTKVVALVVICTIVSTLICGGLSLVGIMGVSNEDASQIMSMECKNNAEEINTTLSRVEQSVDTLASLAEQSLTDLEEFQTDPEYVEEYTEQIRPVALQFAEIGRAHV